MVETAATGPPEGARGTVQVVEPSQLEQGHARRVAESKATVPHVYLETDAEVGEAPMGAAEVVRACALALRDFPRVNGAYRDGRFELYSRINVGFAVAAQGTLLFPTIHDADRKDVAAITAEMRALADRAREATITQPELSGGTFTVADPGTHGVTRSSAIINRGQAAILAIGAVREEPVVRDGQLATARTLTLSLACDNRILQGPEAAGFLARVRALLEQPAGPAL